MNNIHTPSVLIMIFICFISIFAVPAWAQEKILKPSAGWDPNDWGRVAGNSVLKLRDGRTLQVSGSKQILLIHGKRKTAAPDGTYILKSGRKVRVRAGKLVEQMKTIGEDAQRPSIRK